MSTLNQLERIEKVKGIIISETPIALAKIAKRMPDVSERTLRRDIKNIVKKNSAFSLNLGVARYDPSKGHIPTIRTVVHADKDALFEGKQEIKKLKSEIDYLNRRINLLLRAKKLNLVYLAENKPEEIVHTVEANAYRILQGRMPYLQRDLLTLFLIRYSDLHKAVEWMAEKGVSSELVQNCPQCGSYVIDARMHCLLCGSWIQNVDRCRYRENK